METLRVRDDVEIPGDRLSVSYTRHRDEEMDPVEAARTVPLNVELRLATRGWTEIDPALLERILAYGPLKADRRGTIKVTCGEYQSQAENLGAARTRLKEGILAALEAVPDAPEEGKKPRGRRKRVS